MRLALLCSNPELSIAITPLLEKAGHIVHTYDSPRQLLQAVGRESFDLLLIDDSLFDAGFKPFLSRLFVVAGDDLALILINCKDNETRLTDAFAIGADDFIHCGVGARVIAARVDAVLRRRHQVLYQRETKLEFQPYCFNLETRTAKLQDTEIVLTDKEFDLTVFLFQNLGRVFSRSHLLEAIWRSQRFTPTRTVDTHISRIRKRLMINDKNGYRVVSVYGRGYRLEQVHQAFAAPLPTINAQRGTESAGASQFAS